MKTAVINKNDVLTCRKIANGFIRGYNQSLDIMTDKKPRRNVNWEEKIAEWKSWAEETCNER
jgi:hypothetical protein